MRPSTLPRSPAFGRRRLVGIIVLVVAVGLAGIGLASPVWHCKIRVTPGDLAVVTRECRNVPRSRVLLDWLGDHL